MWFEDGDVLEGNNIFGHNAWLCSPLLLPWHVDMLTLNFTPINITSIGLDVPPADSLFLSSISLLSKKKKRD